MLKPLICALFVALAPITSIAGDAGTGPELVSDGDVRAVRAVVEAQVHALAVEDAAEAFSYASPAIKRRFHDAATFIEALRRAYPMLIRPASIGFFRPEAHGDSLHQAVHFRDGEGHLWRAVYELQRQPDNNWRINGCAVAADDDSTTT